MRKMLSSVSIGIAALLAVGADSVGNIGNPGAAGAGSSAEEQPSVYVSTDPNVCANFSGLEYRVFVNSPLDDNLRGISFDVDITGGPFPMPLVIPETGVTFSVVDVSQVPYHFEAAWTPRTLEHEPIFRLIYEPEPSIGGFSPYDVTFETTGGGSLPGYGWETIICCLDCFNCSLGITASDHATVSIGGTTIIPFEWAWYCFYTGSGTITASDTEGWVVSWEPESAGDDVTCGLCVVPAYDGWVEVFVPEDVPAGTTSTLSVTGLVGSESAAEIVLEAENTVSVDNSTWGKIKSLYR